MKKILVLITTFVFLSLSTFAQETKSTETAQKIKKTFESKGKDRLFLVLNHDNLLHKETNGFKTQWYSRGIGAYFMWDFQIKKSEFSVAPGVGYNFAAYYHNARIMEDSTGISFPTIYNMKDKADAFKRSRLAVHYVEVPLELRYRHMFKSNMSLKLAVGIKGSFKVSATSKVVEEGPNGYNKGYNTSNYKDVNNFRVGPTFRVGYGPVNLLMYYDLMPLFKKDRGPKMTPFSIGIAFTTL